MDVFHEIPKYLQNMFAIHHFLQAVIKFGLSPYKKLAFVCFNESSLKVMTNAVFFPVFVLTFGYVGKQLDKKAMANLKIFDVTNCSTKKNCNAHTAQYLKK